MRLLSALTVVFVIIIMLGVYTNQLLHTNAEELSSNIKMIMKEVEQHNWDEAYKQTVAFEKKWHDVSKWWPTIITHQELDNVLFALARLKEYVAVENVELTRGQLSELQLMIEHIPKKEAVTIENIL